jgi:hypothetical protein
MQQPKQVAHKVTNLVGTTWIATTSKIAHFFANIVERAKYVCVGHKHSEKHCVDDIELTAQC